MPATRIIGRPIAVLVLASATLAAAIVVDGSRADALGHTAGGVTSYAVVSSAQVAPGGSVELTAHIRAATRRAALVDVEVHDGAGRKVYQRYWDGVTLPEIRTRAFATTWSVPANLARGPYTVKVGVFGTAWQGMQHWNDRAGALTIDVPAPTTAPTTVAPTTTTIASTTTTTMPAGRFATRPVGSTLPTGAQCAALVRPAAEVRPGNATANHTRGSRAVANNRTDWPGFDRVDGDFAGTTDEIIQWAACKWGIDEDMVRAQVVKESWWHQSANGDNGESWGLGQVRLPYHGSAFEFSVNARTSSAYNLDYTYATWRACYEGSYTWLNSVERGATYAPGDAWGCMGVWFSGRWYTQPAVNYLEGGDTNGYGDRGVKEHFTLRTWTDPAFLAG